MHIQHDAKGVLVTFDFGDRHSIERELYLSATLWHFGLGAVLWPYKASDMFDLTLTITLGFVQFEAHWHYFDWHYAEQVLNIQEMNAVIIGTEPRPTWPALDEDA